MEELNNGNGERRKTEREIFSRVSSLEEWKKGTENILNSISLQVSNHLPTKIEDLGKEMNNIKLSNSRWLVSILVTLIFVLIGLVINILIS